MPRKAFMAPALILFVALLVLMGGLFKSVRAASGDVWAVGHVVGTDDVRVDSSGNVLAAQNLTVAGTLTVGGVKTTTYAPAADNTSDLGTHAMRWKNLHMAGAIYGDGGMDVYTAGALPIGAHTATSVVVTPLLSAQSGLGIKTGANCTAGITGAMTAGYVLVSTTKVKTGSLIFTNGNGTGATRAKGITDSVSFGIYSTDGADTGTASWMIVSPQ